jgi:hypothetical protein
MLTDLEGSITEVAITNKVVKVSPGATVSTPFALMLVPCVTAPVPTTFELTRHVTAELGLFVPVTEALNWRELPACIDWFVGLIVIPVTVGITTVTEALPALEGS